MPEQEEIYEGIKLMLSDPKNDTEKILAPAFIKLSDRIYDLEKMIRKEEK